MNVTQYMAQKMGKTVEGLSDKEKRCAKIAESYVEELISDMEQTAKGYVGAAKAGVIHTCSLIRYKIEEE